MKNFIVPAVCACAAIRSRSHEQSPAHITVCPRSLAPPTYIIAKRISARQLIWVHISANAHVRTYFVPTNTISHAQFRRVTFRNVICHGNFSNYDARREALTRMRIPRKPKIGPAMSGPTRPAGPGTDCCSKA